MFGCVPRGCGTFCMFTSEFPCSPVRPEATVLGWWNEFKTAIRVPNWWIANGEKVFETSLTMRSMHLTNYMLFSTLIHVISACSYANGSCWCSLMLNAIADCAHLPQKGYKISLSCYRETGILAPNVCEALSSRDRNRFAKTKIKARVALLYNLQNDTYVHVRYKLPYQHKKASSYLTSPTGCE